jgi:hypothetical protein
MAILTAQISPTPILLPDHLPISPHLKAVIERMVAKDLRVRYATAADVLRDLRGQVEERNPDATVPVVRPSLSRPMQSVPAADVDVLGDTDQSPRSVTGRTNALAAQDTPASISAELSRPLESTDTMRRRSQIALDQELDFGSAPEQKRLLQERSPVLTAAWALLSFLIIMITLLSLFNFF